jgi:uncharacterized YigZ family protein
MPMATDEYQTIEFLSEGSYKEKGSRFIAVAIPVQSIEEVRLQIEKIRKQYHDARHHCYAYRLGPEPFEFRQNDDGEPSGTAGKPIYGQIQSFGLTNILIVVVRYFGGVKLGTGGLIQAYKTAAKDAIGKGNIISKTWNVSMNIRFDYIHMDPVMRIIRDEGGRIISQGSLEKCAITLEVRKGNYESIVQKLSSYEALEIIVI